jgi:adenylate cyclase
MQLAEEADPEDWAALMDRFFRVLSDGVVRFGGTVDKFTGDGIMALFGAPVSQEDHARRACAAALALRGATAGLGLAVRLGLNSGEVVVGGIGDEGRPEYTALGHTVGLAQRMEALAESGTALVTEHTARLVRGHFALRELGPVAVKGSSEPVRAFVLEAAVRRTGTGGGSAALVGRAEEMAALEAALARAQEGEAQVVGIVGEAGVGKSRLCEELARSATARGITVRRAAGVSHAGDVPFLPVLDLLRDYFGIVETDSRPAAREKISARLLALDRSLAEDLPLVFDFLEVPDEDRPAPRLSPERRMARIFALFRRVTQRRSDREALVLLLEDLHWFDAASRVFFERLIPSFPGTRTLVLTNFRPEFSPPWAAHSYYRQLPLSPLDAGSVGRLLTALLGRDDSLAPLVALITESTGGSPFFVEEVVRSLVEDGALGGEPGAYRLARPVESLQVPATVQATLAARIDRLEPAEKSMLQTAAVIGRHFTEPILRLASDGPASDVDAALGRLCTAEFLQVVPDAAVEEYRFWHPLTQEVAYHSLLRERRAALHGAVARAIVATDPDRVDERAALLATHYDQAGDRLEAVRWNERAGDYALRSDVGESMRRWRTVLRHLEGAPETAETLRLGIRARQRLIRYMSRVGSDPEEVGRLYADGQHMADRLGDPAYLAGIMFAYGATIFVKGAISEAADLFDRASALADQSDDAEAAAAYSFGCAIRPIWLGPVGPGFDAVARVKDRCGGDPAFGVSVLGYSPLSPTSVLHIDLLGLTGRVDEAWSVLEAFLAGPRRHADAEWIAWGWAVAARVARTDTELQAVFEGASASIRAAEASENPFNLGLALLGVGVAELRLGRSSDAAESLQRALTEARQHQTCLFEEVRILVFLARARSAVGDTGGAHEIATEAIDLARRQGARLGESLALLHRARILRAMGVAADVVDADLDAALALARATGATAYEAEITAEQGVR